MNPANTADAVSELGQAVRRPEQLALRWRDRHHHPDDAPPTAIFPVLLAAAVLGLAAYGLSMGLPGGALAMVEKAATAPLACGAAWTLSMPALYILNRRAGSRLDPSTTALVALTTCAFGALAMLASVPVSWFFSLALPFRWVRVLVHLVVFAGVGVAMSDTFFRVVRAVEPERSAALPALWLGLVSVLGTELMALLHLFEL